MAAEGAHDFEWISNSCEGRRCIPEKTPAVSQARNRRRVVFEIRGVCHQPGGNRLGQRRCLEWTIDLSGGRPGQNHLRDGSKVEVTKGIDGGYTVSCTGSRDREWARSHASNEQVPRPGKVTHAAGYLGGVWRLQAR